MRISLDRFKIIPRDLLDTYRSDTAYVLTYWEKAYIRVQTQKLPNKSKLAIGWFDTEAFLQRGPFSGLRAGASPDHSPGAAELHMPKARARYQF